MDLRTFLDSMARSERRAFAAQCGTTLNYLAQLQYGCKRVGPQMARKIHEASGQRVPLESLRPDIWGGKDRVPRRVTNRSQNVGRAGNA